MPTSLHTGGNSYDVLGPARRAHVDDDISSAQMQEPLTPEQPAKRSNRIYAIANI